jgi:beta-glucosidase
MTAIDASPAPPLTMPRAPRAFHVMASAVPRRAGDARVPRRRYAGLRRWVHDDQRGDGHGRDEAPNRSRRAGAYPESPEPGTIARVSTPPPSFDTDPARLGRTFPADFTWGFAASAYQIEGAAAEDGRGPSIWDTFAHQPGHIIDGSTGDVACDHYHRYPEDVGLMADLGARAYRFSISWSRVLPAGTGAVNGRGLDFYERLVDALLGAGVQPLINLFHWDLPEALQDRGGFADPEVVGWFTDYAALIASRLGDRVKDWMTFNEPAVFAFLGHADGIYAPGLRHWQTAIRVADNELRAHAGAAQAIRALVQDARIGLAIDVNQVAPATASERDRVAAERWSSARDAWFLDPLFGRGYPALGLAAHRDAGHLEGVDLKEPPAGDLDYLGLNYYRRDSVSARSDRPFDWEIGAAAGSERTQMAWHIAPEGLRDTLVELHRDYAPTAIVITENGAAYPDTVDGDGRVRDGARRDYLARHVAAAAEALRAGVPLTGYFVWSLLDNYEWTFGYSRRFGLVHVEYGSQRRTLKDSARWYQRLIAGE